METIPDTDGLSFVRKRSINSKRWLWVDSGEDPGAVLGLKHSHEATQSHPESSLSFAESTLKKRRVNETDNDFIYPRFIAPTSSIFEGLFFVAGYAMGDRR